MKQPIPMEQNFLAAMLHGRRSKMAEAGQLDKLCRIRTVHELARLLYPSDPIESALELQRRQVTDLWDELNWLAERTENDRWTLLPWLCTRFQVENLKVLARGRATNTALGTVQSYLIPLPRHLALAEQELLAAESVDDFFAQIPNPYLYKRLLAIDEFCRTQPGTFHLEAALDNAYLGELAFRAQGIVGRDRLPILAAIRQEIDIFHFMLTVRGRFSYGLDPETLMGLHVDGGMALERFIAMLTADDIDAVVEKAVRHVIDTRPTTNDPAELETLAWKRLLRLANKAFRQGHMGMGAVIGYTILRRVELANLITICEGIRTGAAPAALRARLISPTVAEAVHV